MIRLPGVKSFLLASGGAAALAIAVAFALAGCERADSGAGGQGEVAIKPRDEFETAIELVDRAEDFEADSARGEALNRLNRWIENEEPDPGWLADPLIGRMPSRLRDTMLFRDLDAMRFGLPDARFLQHALWQRDLVRWIGRSKLDPLSQVRYEATIAAANPKLSADEAAQLELALLLFDWTVRNIQLEPFPGAGLDDGAGNFPGRGIAGPGYTQFAGQVLLFGHGDAWQRAAVFLLLCHQAGIDATMLAIDPAASGAGGKTNSDAGEQMSRPWLPATLIAGQLYLFDTGLGLAIPAKDGKALATLAQLKNDPSILRALDYSETPAENAADAGAIEPPAPEASPPPEVDSAAATGERYVYPIAADDLKSVSALLFAPVEYLSQRMRLLEVKLPLKQSVKLTMTPSQLAERLRATKELSDVSIWSLPYDMLVYRLALEQQGTANPTAFAAKFAEEQLFNLRHTLVIARRLHLRGDFDRQGQAAASNGSGESADGAATDGASNDSATSGVSENADDAGAKGHYLTARMTDRELEAVLKTPEVHDRYQLKRFEGEDKAAHEVRLNNFARFIRETRPYANYWMGLAHYENRNFDTAATWLKNQVLADEKETKWLAGAQYNLGRARESLGQKEAAIAAFRASQSPQRHGDLLRAKWLEAK